MSAPRSTTMPALLDARDLHTYYGASHILRGVSLRIGAGETVALMGRNGMGKTTLIRTVMGLVRPRSGSVAIDGMEVTAEPTFRIAARGLAYVPEGRGIFASLSVRENLAIAERSPAEGHPQWTMARVLQLFPRLAERIDNGGDQLSGGEQQMLAIARALLTNPRLLILDEATEGLAPLIRDEIWRIIGVVRQTGIAALIVDKNVLALSGIADRVVVLVKGEVAFEGTPADLGAEPGRMQRLLGV
jgi:branched-chain amino acid transport system ATP-binding protein